MAPLHRALEIEYLPRIADGVPDDERRDEVVDQRLEQRFDTVAHERDRRFPFGTALVVWNAVSDPREVLDLQHTMKWSQERVARFITDRTLA